jgi:hypothetical protein
MRHIQYKDDEHTFGTGTSGEDSSADLPDVQHIFRRAEAYREGRAGAI